MKIDLSSLLVVIVMVIPGLFAQRSRDRVTPTVRLGKGATEEFAEFVAFGVTTQILLIFLLAASAPFISLCSGNSPLAPWAGFDHLHLTSWLEVHRTSALLLASAYILCSFVTGHYLGLIYGTAIDRSGALTAAVFRGLGLKSLGIRSLRRTIPFIYELLDQKCLVNETECIIFVEAHMKNDQGIYSGQVERFAIVKDEEPHKPIYLIDPYFRKSRTEDYERVVADGVLLDLAEVSALYVRRETSR